MGRFKISYNNRFIVDKEATGNVPVVYNGKLIGDVVEGRNRTLSCADTKAESRILIGDTILDCKDKLMNTDIFVAYFDDSQGGEFPEEASTYELINTYTTSTTFTAPEYGWYQIEVFGASGSGGTKIGTVTIEDYSVTTQGFTKGKFYSAGGGGGGAYSCSRVKLNKGDAVILVIGDTTSAGINSSLEVYSTITTSKGGNGGDAIDSSAGSGGSAGTANGGNYANKNGNPGSSGSYINFTRAGLPSDNIVPNNNGGSGANSYSNSGGNGATFKAIINSNNVISIGNLSESLTGNHGTGKAGFIKIYRGNTNVEELAPPVSDVLEENDWATISEISKSGNAQNYWSLGDTKAATINGDSYDFQIIGFDHDTVVDPTVYGREYAGITFQMKRVYGKNSSEGSKVMNNSRTNSGGWGKCLMRTSTLPNIKNSLQSDLQSVIVTVKIPYAASSDATSLSYSEDNMFLLSESEVDESEFYSPLFEGEHYEYYAAGNSFTKLDYDGYERNHWLRSVYYGDEESFLAIWADGSLFFNEADISIGSSFPYFIAPAFCV